MTDREQHVVEFYARHPISSEHILIKLRESRGNLDNVSPEELYPHDQDHYGGLDANAAMAERARLRDGAKVADFCAGLGGPARWFARNFGIEVVGIELNPDRVRGAGELTRLVGLDDQVSIRQGNVLSPEIDDNSVDAVLSQEAFLHVPDTLGVLEQAFRILKPGGRLVFTDWVEHAPPTDDEAQDMWHGIAAQTLESVRGYRGLLVATGFEVDSIEDLTGDWADILAERLEMFRRLRAEAQRAGTPAGEMSFYDSYVRLVEHVTAKNLGGARFTAIKP